MKFNITKNLNAYGGRNKWSVPIGTTRNIRGSANRIYNYCDRTTNDPLYCMFQFTPPKPIKGNLIFLYDFTGTNITESIVLDNLPVKILPRVFEITPKVTITGNKVYVEIDSYLYESSSYSNDFGFTFNLQSSILTFYNSFTANLTFVKNYNFPFSRTGRQFAGLTLPFNNLSLSKPYFLPGTSLAHCFSGCTLFNQDIEYWNVSNVTSMNSMFENATAFNNGGSSTISNWSAPLCTTFAGMFVSATSFNQPLTNLVKTSGVESCSMNIMFENATAFNQDIGEWDVSKVTTMSNMFYNAINFNNGSSSTISNWSAPYCTRFAGMFNSNTNSAFNQPLTKLVKTSYVSTTMANMFQNATVFNQNIGEWDVSKVTSMAAMFQNATAFNNGSSDTIKYWEAPYCTDFTNMFYLATSFNQPLTNLVDTSGVTSCTMLNMFRDARAFNNGETGLQNIPNINPPGANYTNTTKILSCPGATFSSTLGVNDVLIIQTSTIVYSSAILNIPSNTSLTLTTAFGSNILTGIISIQKQIPGSNPLNWNTSNVTSLANMFRNAIFFNQNITTNGNIWNTYKVTNLINMFFGSSSSLINLFNNGQIITGQTAPMGWNFNPTTPPTSTNYRTNCRLTASNKPTSLL